MPLGTYHATAGTPTNLEAHDDPDSFGPILAQRAMLAMITTFAASGVPPLAGLPCSSSTHVLTPQQLVCPCAVRLQQGFHGAHWPTRNRPSPDYATPTPYSNPVEPVALVAPSRRHLPLGLGRSPLRSPQTASITSWSPPGNLVVGVLLSPRVAIGVHRGWPPLPRFL